MCIYIYIYIYMYNMYMYKMYNMYIYMCIYTYVYNYVTIFLWSSRLYQVVVDFASFFWWHADFQVYEGLCLAIVNFLKLLFQNYFIIISLLFKYVGGTTQSENPGKNTGCIIITLGIRCLLLCMSL